MNLPTDFIERTKIILNKEWDAFEKSLQETTPTSIRVNRNKNNQTIYLESVKWCSEGYYLTERPSFTFDPLFHAGAYYVQEASSMFIYQAISQLIDTDVRILDLCAAPGGKSTLISSLISENSLLVSNEMIRSRAYILSENMMKWGNPNHIVTNNKPQDYSELKHFFDVMLVDAPCSGEGMFRKDPQSIDEWSLDNVIKCADRQKDILCSTWNCLKPGGYLIYSTCTYNREENEEIVDWLCNEYNANIIDLEIDPSWEISISEVNNKKSYRFFPHKTKGEGFFCAVLQKNSSETLYNKIFREPKKKKKIKESDLSPYHKWIEDPTNFTFFNEDNHIYSLLNQHYSDYIILNKYLNIVSKGIYMGEQKGKDFVPHQSLALSNHLNLDSLRSINIDWKTAVSYLRRESLILSDDTKGYLLLTYENTPLGFVKNLGNRANNLYPNEWRIRSGNTPKDIVKVT